MVLIATGTELGSQLAKVIAQPWEVAEDVDRMMESVQRLAPLAVLLDVKLGGNARRAVESVPALLRAAPGVSVVVLSRAPLPPEIAEADRLGAYTVVDVLLPDYSNRVRTIIAVIRAMDAYRRSQPLSRRQRG